MIINMNGAKAPETPSPALQEKTVTPETLPTVIGADEGYDGLSQVTVNPDAQLKAENIRSGKSIFGVTGVFEGERLPSTLAQEIVGRNVTKISASDNIGTTSIGIGAYAFYDCRNLTSAEIYTADPFGVSMYAFADCMALTSVTFLNGAKVIGDYAFKSTQNLTTISIPDNCENIGSYAFAGSGLTSLDTNNVIYFKDEVTDLCRNLTTITMRNVQQIWPNALGRTYVTRLKMMPTSPPLLFGALYESYTGNLDNFVIEVPAGSLGAYQTASNWATYADHMVEATE